MSGGAEHPDPQTDDLATSTGDVPVDTGDQAVDEILGLLGSVTNEPLDVQIEAGERAQRVLQGRLADLGQE